MTDTTATGEQTQAAEGTAPAPETLLGSTAPAEGEAAAPETLLGDVNAEGEKPAEETKPEGAPESYEFTAPEGRELDKATIATFSDVAKELNLTQDAAQKLVDKMAPAIQAQQLAQLDTARAAWTAQTKTDKEYGGEGLAENLAIAKKGLDAFGTPELSALLASSGLGNHPEIVRAFYRAGKAISEDKFIGGNGATASSNDLKTLYPNSNLN